ncbi:MAG: hypothetical protein ABIO71_09505 [Caldimonas sp.]
MQDPPIELSLVDDDEPPSLTVARSVFLAASRIAVPPPRVAVGPGRGPGWFDSSFELQRGLEVHEAWPGDDGPSAWIDGLFAAPQRSPRPAERRTSSRTASPRSITAMA